MAASDIKSQHQDLDGPSVKDLAINTGMAPHLVLFFTFDVSLKIWRDMGMLSREVRLYQALVEKGWKVTFLTYGDDEDLEIGKDLAPINVIPLFASNGSPKRTLWRLIQSPFLIWKARHALRQADLLKTNQVWGGWNAVLAKLLFRVPLLTRGGFEPYALAIAQKQSALRRTAWRLVSGLSYRFGTGICLATEDNKEFVSRVFSIPGDKITVQPNWVDTGLFKPMECEQLDKHVLFIGRFNAVKNLEALVEAISGTDLTLDLVGGGELEEPLQQLATKLKAKVNFLGRVPNEKLPELINRYPVYTLTSFHEGNPKTLLEAMACGRAVLGTDVPGIQNVIQQNQTGLLCGTDPKSLRESLLRISADSDLRTRLGAAAREYILETNSLDVYVDRELINYGRLTGRAAGSFE